MKTPQFEELAVRWRDKADFYFVFTREAHANARGAERLGQAANMLAGKDADGDYVVTFAEWGGPREMFDPFDLDKDGSVRSHELLAARKITQFEEIQESTTAEQRRALALRFREEVPGHIPVLLDELVNRTSNAYGGMPNSLFVIAPTGAISHAFEWASVREAERALAELLGEAPPITATQPPDWSVLATELGKAEAAGHGVLVQFTAPGCGACEVMERETLSDPRLASSLAGYERVTLGVERDEAWALFEALDLSATPAFVLVAPSTKTVTRQTQGVVGVEQFLEFLAAG
jgi:thiol-disulfide isomerase/thioredoxin